MEHRSTLNALLIGGPTGLPDTERLRHVHSVDQKVKIPWQAGYEHFVATAERREVEGRDLVVFSWTERTNIAE